MFHIAKFDNAKKSTTCFGNSSYDRAQETNVGCFLGLFIKERDKSLMVPLIIKPEVVWMIKLSLKWSWGGKAIKQKGFYLC